MLPSFPFFHSQIDQEKILALIHFNCIFQSMSFSRKLFYSCIQRGWHVSGKQHANHEDHVISFSGHSVSCFSLCFLLFHVFAVFLSHSLTPQCYACLTKLRSLEGPLTNHLLFPAKTKGCNRNLKSPKHRVMTMKMRLKINERFTLSCIFLCVSRSWLFVQISLVLLKKREPGGGLRTTEVFTSHREIQLCLWERHRNRIELWV